jgi:hypothetical protein
MAMSRPIFAFAIESRIYKRQISWASREDKISMDEETKTYKRTFFPEAGQEIYLQLEI